jgi:hypothetical protein
MRRQHLQDEKVLVAAKHARENKIEANTKNLFRKTQYIKKYMSRQRDLEAAKGDPQRFQYQYGAKRCSVGNLNTQPFRKAKNYSQTMSQFTSGSGLASTALGNEYSGQSNMFSERGQRERSQMSQTFANMDFKHYQSRFSSQSRKLAIGKA